MAYMPASSPDPAPTAVPAWRRHAWLLWFVAGIAVATVVFIGYGQRELLLDAVNLRYCG
jgi:hypothetical protein